MCDPLSPEKKCGYTTLKGNNSNLIQNFEIVQVYKAVDENFNGFYPK